MMTALPVIAGAAIGGAVGYGMAKLNASTKAKGASHAVE